MPKSKMCARQAEWHSHLQLATIDPRPPSTAAPKVPKVVIVADVARNEVCVTTLMAAAVTLCQITNPVDRDVLEGALRQAFAALEETDWEAFKKLFCPLGLRLLLWSRLLEAISGVSLDVAHQACKLSPYSQWQCGLSLQRVFETVLDQSMMRKYKKTIEEEEEMTKWINAEVLEG